MHEVLGNRLGGLNLPRKSVVRLTDRPNMTLDVYRGRKTTIQYNIAIIFNVTVARYAYGRLVQLSITLDSTPMRNVATGRLLKGCFFTLARYHKL